MLKYREERLKFYMIVKQREFLFLKIEILNLAEKYDLVLNLICLKFEQDPLNIKDFMHKMLSFAYLNYTVVIFLSVFKCQNVFRLAYFHLFEIKIQTRLNLELYRYDEKFFSCFSAVLQYLIHHSLNLWKSPSTHSVNK